MLNFKVGLDIGSTTIKCVVCCDNEIIFKSYERHKSMAIEKSFDLLKKINEEILKNRPTYFAVSGSSGLGFCEISGSKFVQEVFATKIASKKYGKGADVIIELGGEDAKILFLKGGSEVRMNGSCAGGTGAFIDQMAVLLKTDLEEFDELSLNANKIYVIASRCGVFAKSDVQPLINQGAEKSNLAASIFQAVVNQTIGGLAQGRKIEGKVMFLGGPLTFFKGLRKRFVETLKLNEQTALFPENSQYFVALGACEYAAYEQKQITLNSVIEKLKLKKHVELKNVIPPLFENELEYETFLKRHEKIKVNNQTFENYAGEAFLGIDAGSTTTKMVLLTKTNEILYSKYLSNGGDVVPIILNCLKEIYEKIEQTNNKTTIASCAVTGYGEDLIKKAFSIDFGIVETIAHLTAARHFLKDVDFVIDIGGQDIKCFKLKNGNIDSIVLNEACSSGCGSFLETFALTLGFNLLNFTKLGLFAKHPVDLGSRCTVFMNSSVKQAQKDGATVEDISAGLSISIVKNAIYKVIRANSKEDLGKNIIVQGGTFLNDAVLRAFERELDLNVVRTPISGLMGAFGCALHAKENYNKKSSLISFEDLKNFSRKVKVTNCNGCENRCTLTISEFSNKNILISGNKCNKYESNSTAASGYNMAKFKYNLITKMPKKFNNRKKIGIPLTLNMYENLPFWVAFFEALNFEVVISKKSTRELYVESQHLIPSDTVCYPAKLMHGHVNNLLENDDVCAIFIPCMTYSFNENLGSNNYNCPVVAYYPEVVKSNLKFDETKKIIIDYLDIENKKNFKKFAFKIFSKYFEIEKQAVNSAVDLAYENYYTYKQALKNYSAKAIDFANKNEKEIIVVADKPYHIDPEINHGIYDLIENYGAVVLTSDAVAPMYEEKVKTKILNQWTYHARLFAAAKEVTKHENMNLVHLVSFGCGIEAIASDEIRRILEEKNKIYTQLKIDEIANLGAVKIRIRSLFETIEKKKTKPMFNSIEKEYIEMNLTQKI